MTLGIAVHSSPRTLGTNLGLQAIPVLGLPFASFGSLERRCALPNLTASLRYNARA